MSLAGHRGEDREGEDAKERRTLVVLVARERKQHQNSTHTRIRISTPEYDNHESTQEYMICGWCLSGSYNHKQTLWRSRACWEDGCHQQVAVF